MNKNNDKPLDFNELRLELQSETSNSLIEGEPEGSDSPALPDLLFTEQVMETDGDSTVNDLKNDLQGSIDTMTQWSPVDIQSTPRADNAAPAPVAELETQPEVPVETEYEATKLDQSEIDELARQLEEKDRVKAPERHAFLTDEQIQERQARSVGRSLLPTIEHVSAPAKPKRVEPSKQSAPKSFIPDIAKGKEAFFDRKAARGSSRRFPSLVTAAFLASYLLLLGGFFYGHHKQIESAGFALLNSALALTSGASDLSDQANKPSELVQLESNGEPGSVVESSSSQPPAEPAPDLPSISYDGEESDADTDTSSVSANADAGTSPTETNVTGKQDLNSDKSYSTTPSFDLGVDKNPPEVRACLAVQGLSRSSFKSLFQTLTDKVDPLELKDSSIPSSYVVFLSKERSSSESQLAALRSKGVKDTFRIPSGPLAGNLSLGLFKDEASAQRQKSMFERSGISGLNVGPRSYIRAVDFRVESTLLNVQTIKASIQNEPHVRMSAC